MIEKLNSIIGIALLSLSIFIGLSLRNTSKASIIQ